MLLSHVCGTQSICCLTGNTMPHVCFTLSISCLLLCCCPMSVALSPFAVLLVIPYPMSLSLCPSAVCCYVAVPCLFHSVHQLSAVMLLSHVCGTQSICCLTGNTMPHVCFTLSISCLLLCCCPMSVALHQFAVLLVMPYPTRARLQASHPHPPLP